VRTNDQANRHYVRTYLNANVSDPLHYDLVLNTGKNGFERVARIICAALLDLATKGRGRKATFYPPETNGQEVGRRQHEIAL
jgi:hypothetical protein